MFLLIVFIICVVLAYQLGRIFGTYQGEDLLIHYVYKKRCYETKEDPLGLTYKGTTEDFKNDLIAHLESTR